MYFNQIMILYLEYKYINTLLIHVFHVSADEK